MHQTSTPRPAPQQPQPLAGAIIDAEGREIAITEQMIQRACRELERQGATPFAKRG